MPELPEVETTRIGVAAHVLAETVTGVEIRDHRLRWPVPADLPQLLCGATILKLDRRGKYLVFHTDHGCLLLHLGMSGSLRILTQNQPAAKHDHVDIIFASGTRLRFRDPRRFGSLHWTREAPEQHPLLRRLGPEPLGDDFNADYLFEKSRGRRQNIKSFLMDSQVVVGIGNIYASESLFLAGIHPQRPAGQTSRARYQRLVAAAREVLQLALAMGGTTLRDFVNGAGEPGYFRHKLKVYGRAGEPCYSCNTPVRVRRLGQRSTFYCSRCQR